MPYDLAFAIRSALADAIVPSLSAIAAMLSLEYRTEFKSKSFSSILH